MSDSQPTVTTPPPPPPTPDIWMVSCPHCGIAVEVVELNCRIFRCGILKATFTQISPHLPKEECDTLVEHNLIYGCGKPFRIPEGSRDAVVCEYI
jgi:hypothetical protein